MIARGEALSTLESQRFGLVVVGGGITGAGVALDAASRGYSVALVEREDYAAGTSSRSSKLIHGGLRYLRNFDFGLVFEALLERSLLVKLAPGLVRPLPILVPALKGRPDVMTGVGLNLYDVFASKRARQLAGRLDRHIHHASEHWSPQRHRRIGGDEVAALLPALAGREPTSGYLFFDAQTDDVRLVLAVLREAGRLGAVMANRCEVTGLLEEGDRVCGVACTDRLSGRVLEVRADHVINATGVWADRIKPRGAAAEEVPRISPSRGTHLTVARETLPVNVGAIVPADGGRTIFVLPWLGRTLIGTTDNDYDGPLDHVPPSAEDTRYLLDACNEYFALDLGPADLTGAFAGVRPLISRGDPRDSVDISRRAEVYETGSGLVTITGGKYTTFRRMAEQAVDRIVARDDREAPCRTDDIRLNAKVVPGDLPVIAGVGDESRTLLAERYGRDAESVLALAAEDPSLTERISPDLPDLLAEARFAARDEQALSVADVLLRRTRLAILDAPRMTAPDGAAPRAVARAMAPELGWDEARIGEVEAWREVAVAEGVAAHETAAASGDRAGDNPHVPA